MAYNIGIKLGVDGEAEFRRSINNINDQYKTLKTELATVTSAFDKNDKSQENLTKQNEILTKQIELQRKKVAECSDVLDRSSAKFGENSKQTQSWQRAVNGATADLNKLELQLKANENVLITQKSSWVGLGKSLDDAGAKIDVASEKLMKTGGLTTIGITAPIIAAGKAAVGLASDYNESLNKVDVAFGDSADSVVDWSETTLDSFGIAGGTALDMAALFGDMATSMGIPQDQAAKLSTSMTGLAGDLASFKNIGIDQAMTALNGVFTGETESLKQIGIVMTETNLDAYALANGFGKTTNEMSQSEKVMLRYQYVMEMTKNSHGDFANTADGTANSLRTMEESVKELGASFGEELLPEITPIIQNLTKMIKNFGDLDPEMKKTVITTLGITAAIGPLVLGIGGVVKAVGISVTAVRTAIGVIDVLALGATAATPAIAGLSAAITFMTGPVGITITVLAALAAGIAVVASSTAKNTEEQKKALKVHDDYIQSNTNLVNSVNETAKSRKDSTLATEGEAIAAKTLADKIFDLADKQNKSAYEMSVLDVWVDQFNGLMPTANLLIDEQTGALSLTKDATYDLINAELQRIQLSAATEALTEITKEQLKIAQQMTTGTIEANDAEQTHLANLDKINNSIMTNEQRTAAINFENQQYGKTLSETKTSMESLTDQQKTLAGEYQTYEQFIADPTATQEYIKNAGMTVTNTDGTIKDINTLWAEYKANTPNTTGAAGAASTSEFKRAIDAGIPGVTQSAQNSHDAVTNKTSTLPSELYSHGNEGVFGLGSSLGAGTPWIGINANNIHDTITNATNPLPGELGATGTNSVTTMGGGIDVGAPIVGAASQGIFDVITGRLNPLGQFGQDTGASVNAGLRGGMEDHNAIDLSVGGIVQWVLDAFNIGFDIHSPAKKMHPVGVNVLKGLFEGANSLDIAGFANSMVQRLIDAFNNGKVTAMSLFNSMGQEGSALLGRMGINLGLSGGGLPTSGDITSYFGYRDDVGDVGSSNHMGIDIGAAEGTPIYAAEGGTVSESSGSGYGNLIIIDTGAGIQEYYGHMSAFGVSDGATVKKGDLIGYVGSTGNSTGPHLHFGVLKDGEWVDPMAYYGFSVGSRYIPYDMPAMVHQGEMIIPKSENPYANSGGQVLPQFAQVQPATINLVLQNGTKIAEYLIDDINNLLGVKTGMAGRGMA